MEVPRILVVDDEPMVAEVVERYLEREGFQVAVARDGLNAISTYELVRPHLIVLDLMLPGVNGLDVCRRIRETSSAPIIMLTARGDEMDRIAGFELGADDYMAKPFSPRELVVRVKAVLRRCYDGHTTPAAAPIRSGDVVLDPLGRTVEVDGSPVDVTPREFDLLCFLMERPNQVFTRDQLMQRVWNYEWYGDASTVTVHVRRLRTKIEPNPSEPRHLKTAWGAGYKWES